MSLLVKLVKIILVSYEPRIQEVLLKKKYFNERGEYKMSTHVKNTILEML
jgi:hypothetical protein